VILFVAKKESHKTKFINSKTDMKNNKKKIFALFLILSIGNFMRLPNNGSIRLIQFISIFIVGVFAALLVNEFKIHLKSK
jgi:hypothetical protein